MVKETAPLVNGAVKVLDAIEQGQRSAANDGFREILKAMEKIETCMEGMFTSSSSNLSCLSHVPSYTLADNAETEMWKNSKPSDYLSFRVFIFGITSQSMFPNGVVYEGINDNKPLYFRGESGANDSIV